ncbi:hypothetical protein Igag_1477 [Ignisphaera aggregans DSM 17230]|uniref:Uncharacterized protein n=1 Tax=Ignisphaera aggregans (strain DSM 17230 / JCM 13409 / AQ1.S1) TaxID=583356 RepID=E0SQU9_IGNAA|nr:hypothetical protein Igag_1477 [Ignisphaera aggregans DSM 17230]
MDLDILVIVISVLIATLIISTVSTIKPFIKKDDRDKTDSYNYVYNISSNIKKGYAYTVDVGDSLVVVAVIEKRNSSGFLMSQEQEINVASMVDGYE